MSKARLTLLSVISIFLVTALVLPGLATAKHHNKHHKKHQTKHQTKPQTKSCVTTGCRWVYTFSDGSGGYFGTGNHTEYGLKGAIPYVCSDGPHSVFWFERNAQSKIDAAGNFSLTSTHGFLTLQFSGKITGKTASGTFSVTSDPPYNCHGGRPWTAQGNY